MNGLSLCAGIGGFDLALRLALGESYRTVCYVERETFAAATLVARMQDGSLDEAPIWDDLRSFDARPWRGVVDIVTAGYPCQPFSVAGRGRGESDERHLWPHVARVVSECEPSLVFCENVPPHLSKGFDVVARDLQDLGFLVAAILLRAEDVGAPHKRERLFFLALNLADFDGEGCTLVRQPNGDVDAGAAHGDDAHRRDSKVADSDVERLSIGQEQSTRQERATAQRGRGQVADADIGGQRRSRTAGTGAAATLVNGRIDVADADSEREREQDTLAGSVGGRRSGPWPASTAHSAPVSNADDAGWHERSGDVATSRGRYEPANAGDAVPNTERDGVRLESERDQRQGRRVRETECEYTEPDDARGAWSFAFPPGPHDVDGWRRLLEVEPRAQPAVRRDDDGVSDRLDRLRALGNAVVPAVAALAFGLLYRELRR